MRRAATALPRRIAARPAGQAPIRKPVEQLSIRSPSKPKGDATTGQSPTVHDESEAKDQPEVATGEDLKGPPRQFPPSKTPE